MFPQNNNIDVVLIAPPTPTPGVLTLYNKMGVSLIPPLGLGYLASVLKGNGCSVDIFNLFGGVNSIKQFKHIIKKRNPLIVGFNTTTETYRNSLLLANICKSILNNVIIVFGGPHASIMDQETLEDRNVDIVVRFEGEETFLELVKYFKAGVGSLDKIKGITYKSKTGIITNPDRPFIKDLDTIPFPVRDCLDLYENVINEESISNKITFITSRGCPYHCKFCAASKISGGVQRKRTPENVIAEILTSVKNKMNTIISFADDTLTADVERLSKFMTLLKYHNLKWVAESRVDIITEELCCNLKDAGCKALQLGIESGSQKMLDLMCKGTDLDQIRRAVKYITDVDIAVICSFMIGIPGDTKETIRETIDFAKELAQYKQTMIFVGCTVPYPGTFIYHNSGKLNINIKTNNYNLFNTLTPIIDSDYLKADEIRNLLIDGSLEIYQNTPKATTELLKDKLIY